MKKIIFFLLPALLLPCTAKELIIAEKNCNSAWQIVVPEPVGNKALDDYVALGGKVIINLIECSTSKEWYYAGYYTNAGNEANYDIYDVSGWGPDYGDPQTYLDTFLPDYAGYMVKCIGIF